MSHPTKRATQLREATAHPHSIHTQSALEYGYLAIHSTPGTPEASDIGLPAPSVQNALDDEEILVHINEQDPDNSPPSVPEMNTQRSGTDHQDPLDEDEEDMLELEGEELLESLNAWIEGDSEDKEGEGNDEPSAYDLLMRGIVTSGWKKAESNGSLGYNGLSSRSKRWHAKAAKDREDQDQELRKSSI